MADSAKDSKVEDVLSSVRRLVSEEVPRTTRTPVPPGPGALVLTDADRVTKDPLSQTKSRSLEQRIAELEAAVDRGGQEFEPDGSEDPALNIPDRIVYTRPPTSEEEAKMRGTLRLSEIALIKTEPTDEVDTSTADIAPVVFRSTSKEREKSFVPEAPMVEDVPTEPARKANVTAFTNPDEFVERIDARVKQASEPSPQEGKSQPAPQTAKGADAKQSDDFDAALMAAVKASVAEVVQTEVGNALEQKQEKTPQPEAATIATSEPNVKANTQAAAIQASDDNEALRRLVAELIREEFQGELGERITRNIRKLVRREIKRALTSESLL